MAPLKWNKIDSRDEVDSTGRFRLYLDECWILTCPGDPTTHRPDGSYITVAWGTKPSLRKFAQQLANGDPEALAAVEREKIRQDLKPQS